MGGLNGCKGFLLSTKAVTDFVLAVGVLLAVSLPGFSQGSQGTIRGAIFDQSEGAIAGATITVTDVARGTMRALVPTIPGNT